MFPARFFVFERLLTLLGFFDVTFRFSRADATDIQLTEQRVGHMMHITDDLMPAHFAHSRRCAEVGDVGAGPAAFGNIVALPQILICRQIRLADRGDRQRGRRRGNGRR